MGPEVKEYTEILLKLIEFADEAAVKTLRRGVEETTTPGEHWNKVAECFDELSESLLNSLPDEARHGAVVTLAEYGRKNHDDIIRRIREGSYRSPRGGFERG